MSYSWARGRDRWRTHWARRLSGRAAGSSTRCSERQSADSGAPSQTWFSVTLQIIRAATTVLLTLTRYSLACLTSSKSYGRRVRDLWSLWVTCLSVTYSVISMVFVCFILRLYYAKVGARRHTTIE